MSNLPSERTFRKYLGFPKRGEVYGTLDVNEAIFDVENGTWEVHFDGRVARADVHHALQPCLNQAKHIPTDVGLVPFMLRLDSVSRTRINPPLNPGLGAITIAKGHLSLPNIRRNPCTVAEFNDEFDKMLSTIQRNISRNTPTASSILPVSTRNSGHLSPIEGNHTAG